jgi:predicted aspartyl protease
MRLGERKSKVLLLGALALFGPLLLPGMAEADCPPPQTASTSENFYYCFDGSKIGPQPIIEGDKGPFIVAEVELNGHKLPALLDTGAEISVVDSSIAKEIGLKAGGSYGIDAMNGKQAPAQKASIDQLVVGGFIRKGGIVAVADLSAMRQAAKQPFAMMLGADVLSQVALFVDRDNLTLMVIPNNAKANGANWTAPLRFQQPGNLIMTNLSVDGHPMTVKFDTGAQDELILRDVKWAEIVPPTARVTTLAGADAAGPSVVSLVRLNDVRIGDKSIGDAIATRVSSASSTGQSDGILGMGILSRYTLFLNPQTGVMVLTEPKKPVPPRRETMVGIQGVPTDDGLAIAYVMAHSPAEAAGLKAGDRICTIDGQTVRAAWVGTPKNDWMTGPEGKTVLLGRCGGGSVRLTLRRFY